MTTTTDEAPTVHDIRRAVDALSPDTVAERCAVDPTTVGRWTAGISAPPRSKWARIRACVQSADRKAQK